jgi:hypothetical protein
MRLRSSTGYMEGTNMRDQEDVGDEAARIARRSILKGVAAVPLVWAAPAIATVGSRALAASVNPLCNNECDSLCANQHQCGNEGLFDFCGCTRDEAGECFCWANVFCADVLDCADSSTCPPGWSCVGSCCPTTKCLPPCGVIISSDSGSGPTAAGR